MSSSSLAPASSTSLGSCSGSLVAIVIYGSSFLRGFDWFASVAACESDREFGRFYKMGWRLYERSYTGGLSFEWAYLSVGRSLMAHIRPHYSFFSNIKVQKTLNLVFFLV